MASFRTMPASTAGRTDPLPSRPHAQTMRRRPLAPRPRRATPVCAAASADGATPSSSSARPKLAVFVSGGGSNLRAIHAATLGDGRVQADIAVRAGERERALAWGTEEPI